MTFFTDMRLAASIALRDMRGGARALVLLVAGVFVGAAAVALVGAASTSLVEAARKGALEAVGGDISLRLFHHAPSEAQLSKISEHGTVSVTAELRPMVRGKRALDASISDPALVELKGVDLSYPLYGQVKIEPSFPLYESLKQEGGVYGAVADEALLAFLGLELGDALLVGEAEYQLRGVLTHEPDRAFRAFTLGPRVMVLTESFATAAIGREGEEVYYYTRLKLPGAESDPQAVARALDQIDAQFPEAGWRMVNAHEGVPGVERTLAMAHMMLLFIGLGVMLVGGAGISGAVRAHINAKTEVIAILKSIGTPPRVVTWALGMEVLVTAGVGALLGVGVGAFGPSLAAGALAGQLPFALDVMPAAKPLAAAGLFGMLVAALFAWWPLMSVQGLNARVLLRERLDSDPQAKPARPGRKVWAGAAVIASAIGGVVFWTSPMPVFTLVFLCGALVLALIYYALGRGLARLAAGVARGRSAAVRLSLANLHRAGAPTGPVVMALGLTLTLLVALYGLGDAAGAHVRSTLPAQAPDLVAFSLPPDTANAFEKDLTDMNVAKTVRVMPFLHARVQAIKGVPVRDLNIPRSLGWVVRGDRGVSFSANAPPGGEVVAGEWWTAQESQGIAFSLDAGVARKLGLDLGDEISLNVVGRTVTGPIKNLRAIDWTGLDLDFPIIATPGALQMVPHTYAAALKAWPDGGADMEYFIKAHYPDVPLIRVDDVLQALAKALDAVVAGLMAAAWMCGAAALVVLAGSVMQGLSARIDEAVLFKVLGARKGQLMGLLALEFTVLGVLVALAAVPLGLGVAFGVAQAAGLASAQLTLTGALVLAALGIAVTVGVGLLVTLGAYAVTPARVLRNRGL